MGEVYGRTGRVRNTDSMHIDPIPYTDYATLSLSDQINAVVARARSGSDQQTTLSDVRQRPKRLYQVLGRISLERTLLFVYLYTYQECFPERGIYAAARAFQAAYDCPIADTDERNVVKAYRKLHRTVFSR